MITAKIKSMAMGAVGVLCIWFAAFWILDSHIMPDPLLVFRAMPGLLEQNIFMHFRHSLFRVIMGLFSSMAIGLVIGILSAGNNLISKLLNPFIYFTYPIPRIALLPVIMLIFGLGNTSKVIMITLVVVYPTIIVVRDSVRDIPKEIYNVLTCYGASRRNVFFYITLPWAFSAILSTLRISLGTAIAILFITETFGTTFGMGFFIQDAWMRLNYIQMYAGIVVLSFAGFLLFMVIDIVEDVLLKWKKEQI